MPNISTNTAQELLLKRDKKCIPHLEQYAPVWIINQEVVLQDEAVVFNVLFVHPHPNAGTNRKAHWVSRRYRYDGFNDTLYYMGQQLVDEEDALEYMDEEPYINVTVTDMPNSYGG